MVVNDVGVVARRRGTDEDPAGAGVRARSRPPAAQAVPNHDSVSDFEGAGRHRRRPPSTPSARRHPREQRGHRAGPDLRQDGREPTTTRSIAVHQKGTFNAVRHAAPLMKDAGYGRIVNITSSAGLRGNFGQTNYGAAKAAIMGMTFVWALELGKLRHHRQRRGPGRAHPHDRELLRRRGAAARAGPRAQRAAGGVPRLGGRVVRERPGPRAHGLRLHLFQTPRQIASMWREGGWTPGEVAERFHEMLGQHLQPVGMGDHPLLGKRD